MYESSGLACLNLRGEPYVLDVFEQDKGVTNPKDQSPRHQPIAKIVREIARDHRV